MRVALLFLLACKTTPGPGTDSGASRDSGPVPDSDSPADTQLESGTIEIVSDSTWRALGANEGVEPPEGWNQVGFDDSGWPGAMAPNPTSCGADLPVTEPWQRAALPMWEENDLYDSYFRKQVTVPDGAQVSEAIITVLADDDIAVWVNGAEVYVEPDFGKDEDTGFDNLTYIEHVDLSSALVPGSNLIAVQGRDSAGGCRWAIVSGSLTWTR